MRNKYSHPLGGGEAVGDVAVLPGQRHRARLGLRSEGVDGSDGESKHHKTADHLFCVSSRNSDDAHVTDTFSPKGYIGRGGEGVSLSI